MEIHGGVRGTDEARGGVGEEYGGETLGLEEARKDDKKMNV